MKRIVGVTLKHGREIRFDKNSLPLVRGDTLQAEAGSQPLAIAVSDIRRASVKSLNKTKTGLAVFGIGFVLATVYIGIGFSGI